jgi:beta-N-acetylhexosaminidase
MSDRALERLVDAVLLPGFVGTTVPDWLARRLEGGLAGVCWFAQNVSGADQAADLAAALHAAGDAVLVASDEEGGDVTRLEAADGSSWPGSAALGRLDDVAATRSLHAALGAQARRAGIDLVLGPVVDVSCNPDNPVIGIRSFGADAELVSRHSAAAVEGLQSAGVAACAKHFPGHGDTSVDSHLDLPTVPVDLETLRARELAPFAAAVRAGVRAVLTAHVRFPALDDAPATLSAPVLSLLRDELGFDGVLVSDALDMRAISAGVGRGRGAVLALAAGVDLLCIGNPDYPERYDSEQVLDAVRSAVLAAVGSGELATARLEQAADRVRALAGWVAARPPATLPDDGTALARDVTRRVVEHAGPVRLEGVPHVLDLRGGANVAAGRHVPRLLQALRARVPATTSAPAGGADVAAALAGASDRPVVALVGAPHRDPDQQGALDALLSLRPDVVVVQTGLPDARDRLGERWVRTWGGGRVNAEVAAELLVGP